MDQRQTYQVPSKMDLNYSIPDMKNDQPVEFSRVLLYIFGTSVASVLFMILVTWINDEQYLRVIAHLTERCKELENEKDVIRKENNDELEDLTEQLETMKNELHTLRNIMNQIPERAGF